MDINENVETMLSYHKLIRGAFGDKLMARQISIENDKERKELLRNCEERIGELRAMLINKEAEINFLDFDIGR